VSRDRGERCCRAGGVHSLCLGLLLILLGCESGGELPVDPDPPLDDEPSPLLGVVDAGERAHAILTAEAPGDRAGWSVDSAGDTDGDGLDEILVGAPFASGGFEEGGAVYLVHGSVEGVHSLDVAAARLDGEHRQDRAGWAVAGVGDTNADGRDDVLVGAPYAIGGLDERGAVYLVRGPFDGAQTLASAHVRYIGERDGDRIGTAVAAAGDVNGDGRADSLIGSPYLQGDAGEAGGAYLVLHAMVGQQSISEADVRILGEVDGDDAGAAVASAGDVNGDGFGDILVGAPGESTVGEHAGAAYLLHGPMLGEVQLADAAVKFTGDQGSELEPNGVAYSGDLAGYAVGPAGDTDGDGAAEILVGAPCQDLDGSRECHGIVHALVAAGDEVVALGHTDVMLAGATADEGAGVTLGPAGDVDGDGRDDILIGTTNSYQAYLLYGPVDHGLGLEQADVIVTGGHFDALAGAGDLDGDGYDDVVLGAPITGHDGIEGGAVFVFRGGPVPR
jgi:hypothetical protein